ncbi:MAG: hypothetical protein IJ875_05795 [Solobacterium sp.]|nr:hypothetical protein [Solobacterium sp.]
MIRLHIVYQKDNKSYEVYFSLGQTLARNIMELNRLLSISMDSKINVVDSEGNSIELYHCTVEQLGLKEGQFLFVF